MCGICGYAGYPKLQLADLQAMTQTLFHRGPDSKGTFHENGFGLGMRRLSIIDVVNGDQPIFNESEEIVAVLNGEIYNYLELREQLIARGHFFRTHTDTECLVHLYEECGSDLVDQLSGMYAFAIYDRCKRLLLLGRDRMNLLNLILECCILFSGSVSFQNHIQSTNGFVSFLLGVF
jgi:asparagine synthase (glutamine-hydrolysing)